MLGVCLSIKYLKIREYKLYPLIFVDFGWLAFFMTQFWILQTLLWQKRPIKLQCLSVTTHALYARMVPLNMKQSTSSITTLMPNYHNSTSTLFHPAVPNGTTALNSTVTCLISPDSVHYKWNPCLVQSPKCAMAGRGPRVDQGNKNLYRKFFAQLRLHPKHSQFSISKEEVS